MAAKISAIQLRKKNLVLFFGESRCAVGNLCDDLRPSVTERSSAWLEHLLWEQDVAGSNPVAPTISRQMLHFAKVDEQMIPLSQYSSPGPGGDPHQFQPIIVSAGASGLPIMAGFIPQWINLRMAIDEVDSVSIAVLT